MQCSAWKSAEDSAIPPRLAHPIPVEFNVTIWRRRRRALLAGSFSDQREQPAGECVHGPEQLDVLVLPADNIAAGQLTQVSIESRRGDAACGPDGLRRIRAARDGPDDEYASFVREGGQFADDAGGPGLFGEQGVSQRGCQRWRMRDERVGIG